MNKWIIFSVLFVMFFASCEKDQIGRYDLSR